MNAPIAMRLRGLAAQEERYAREAQANADADEPWPWLIERAYHKGRWSAFEHAAHMLDDAASKAAASDSEGRGT